MRKKQIILLVMIALSLFIAGCSGTDTISPSSSQFVGGTKGITFDFLAGSPPDEIYDNGEYSFSIAVQATNEGEADLEASDGYIKIEGISAAEFGVSSSELTQDIPPLRGNEKNANGDVLNGDIDVVSFDGLNYQQNIAGNIDSTIIRAVACYNYKTQASASVCLKDETIDQTSENDVCDITGSKTVSNSGGPIQISQVTESSRGKDGIQLSFTITNQGEANDRFFKVDTDCDRKVNNPEKDIVYIDVSAIDNGRLNARCTGFKDGNGGSTGFVYLPGGESRKVICTYDTESVENDFETRVNVELSYRYMQYIEKPILIKDIGGDD